MSPQRSIHDTMHPHDPITTATATIHAARQALHLATLGLSYVVLLYLLIRICCARNNYVRSAFPARCYRNAFGTVPPACVRLNGESPPGPYAHGLSAPLVYTPAPASVAHLVEAWAKKQFQTKVKLKTATGDNPDGNNGSGSGSGVFYHMVAVTGFLGFVDDLEVAVECIDVNGGATPATAANGTVVVRVQSEQRFGTLDGGVNKRRVASLVAYIDKKAKGLPPGPCTPPPPPPPT